MARNFNDQNIAPNCPPGWNQSHSCLRLALVPATVSAYVVYSYDSTHRRLDSAPKNSSDKEYKPSISDLDSSTHTLILNLKALLPATYRGTETPGNLTDQIMKRIRSFHIPTALKEPSPRTFFIACIIFGLAIATLRRSQNSSKHRDRILGLGIAVGIGLAMKSQDFLMDVKGYVAWSAIAALLASSVVHRTANVWGRRKTWDRYREKTIGQRDFVGDDEVGEESWCEKA